MEPLRYFLGLVQGQPPTSEIRFCEYRDTAMRPELDSTPVALWTPYPAKHIDPWLVPRVHKLPKMVSADLAKCSGTLWFHIPGKTHFESHVLAKEKCVHIHFTIP